LYSIKDMVEIKSGIFLKDLMNVQEICEKHIRFECEVSLCYYKMYNVINVIN